MRFGALPDAEHSHVQHPTTVTPALSRRDVLRQMLALTLGGATISGCASRDVPTTLQQTVTARGALPPDFAELPKDVSIMRQPFYLQIATPTGEKTLRVEFVNSTRIKVNGEAFEFSEIIASGQKSKATDTVPIINVPIRELVQDVKILDGIVLHGEQGHIHLPDSEFRRCAAALSDANGKDMHHTVSGLSVGFVIKTPPIMGFSIPIEGQGSCDVTFERTSPPKTALTQR